MTHGETNMTTKKIRVTCRNNSDARGFDLLPRAKHNGGKLVIVLVDSADLASAQQTLDDAHEVASYEVTDS